MRLLGAEVVPVTTGSRTLKDAINEAYRDWVASVETTNYIFGTAAGPHPFRRWSATSRRSSAKRRVPNSSSVSALRMPCSPASAGAPTPSACSTRSSTTRASRSTASRRPATVVDTPKHAASIGRGRPGVLHGARTYVLQDEDGQTTESHSISAAWTTPVGPEHAWLADWVARRTSPPPTTRRCRPCACFRAPRASSPRSSRRTPWPAPCASDGRWARMPSSRSTLGSRRQGHGHRGAVFRPLRRRARAGGGERPRADACGRRPCIGPGSPVDVTAAPDAASGAGVEL